MPSPIGHTLGGLIVHVATAEPHEIRRPRRALLLACLATAPDLDLLLNLAIGPGHHRAEGHSLGASVLAGLAVAAASRLSGKARPAAQGLAAGLAWFSHVALDALGSDSNPPYGVMALWPLVDGFMKSPIPLFLDIGRTLEGAILCQNALAAAWEMAVLLPVLVAVWRWRERRRS